MPGVTWRHRNQGSHPDSSPPYLPWLRGHQALQCLQSRSLPRSLGYEAGATLDFSILPCLPKLQRQYLIPVVVACNPSSRSPLQ